MISVKTHVKPKSARRVLREVGYTRRNAQNALFDTVVDLTLGTHQRAVRGVQRGPATGRLYKKYKPQRIHRASAPGQYPMSDTGRLASSIKHSLPDSYQKPVGQVYTNLRYGKYLELKSAARGGRPWLKRSFDDTTKQVQARLLANLKKRRR